MNFKDFVGNENVKSQIITLFKNKKIPHAILIEGTKGIGKRTFAEIIARDCICSARNEGVPCDECLDCRKAQKGIHPDIIYPEKSGVIKTYAVATIREIRENAYIIANEALLKVYIFTDIDNMGLSAQNALLKILEEPPTNVVFIFTCESASALLPTIRSRTQIFSLGPVSVNEVYEFLVQKYPDKENEMLEKISNASGGNIGLAEELLTSTDFEKLYNSTNEFALSIGSAREFDLLANSAKILENRKTFEGALAFFRNILHNALVLSTNAQTNVSCDRDVAEVLSKKLSLKQILNLIEITNLAEKYLERNVNLTILGSDFCSKVYAISHEN